MLAALSNGGRPQGEDQALARFILELRSKGVTAPALMNAFEAVPRAPFLPAIRPGFLYEPIALPIPCGEQATDPFTLARLVLLLGIQPGQRLLEIGTGSGYLTAILVRLGAEVTSLERYRTLLAGAEAAFDQVSLARPRFLQADGLSREPAGLGGGAFDRILIDGALGHVPAHLLERLAPGGAMLAYRLRGGISRLTLWQRQGSLPPVESDFGPARTAPMREGLPASL